jgi:hypothetical protein
LEESCPREADVLDALASARWPNRVERELTDHVASCAICTDVLAVASAIQFDHDAAWKEASVPSSGQMWWRVEMRAKQDAIREASRPVAVAQGVAVLFALALAGAAGWRAWPLVREYLSSASLAQLPAVASPLAIPLVVALGALLVVTPLALYVVLSDE